MNRSNVYRYLRTLVDTCWLEYDEESRKFRIGAKPIQIAGASLQQLDLRTIARPFLEDLAEKTGLAVHLGVLDYSSIVYIDKVESNSPIQMRSRIGMTAPVYCTAMGKVLLSTLSLSNIKNLIGDDLPRRTSNTITSFNKLLEDINRIRENGYSIDLEENEVGIGCVASGIFGYDDEMIGAVSISTLIQNLTPNIEKFSAYVMRCSNQISQSMGYSHKY